MKWEGLCYWKVEMTSWMLLPLETSLVRRRRIEFPDILQCGLDSAYWLRWFSYDTVGRTVLTRKREQGRSSQHRPQNKAAIAWSFTPKTILSVTRSVSLACILCIYDKTEGDSYIHDTIVYHKWIQSKNIHTHTRFLKFKSLLHVKMLCFFFSHGNTY